MFWLIISSMDVHLLDSLALTFSQKSQHSKSPPLKHMKQSSSWTPSNWGFSSFSSFCFLILTFLSLHGGHRHLFGRLSRGGSRHPKWYESSHALHVIQSGGLNVPVTEVIMPKKIQLLRYYNHFNSKAKRVVRNDSPSSSSQTRHSIFGNLTVHMTSQWPRSATNGPVYLCVFSFGAFFCGAHSMQNQSPSGSTFNLGLWQ